MSALVFCVAALFAGASSEQVFSAVAPSVIGGILLAALWIAILEWRAAMDWLRSA